MSEEPRISYTVERLMDDLKGEVRAMNASLNGRLDQGFGDINRRLDDQNGRLRKVETVQAEGRGKNAVLAVLAGLGGSGLLALVLWLVQRAAA